MKLFDSDNVFFFTCYFVYSHLNSRDSDNIMMLVNIKMETVDITQKKNQFKFKCQLHLQYSPSMG